MDKENQNRRLPDGTYTRDVDLYCDTWRKLARHVPAIFGEDWEVIGYDPGVLIGRYPKNRYGEGMPGGSLDLTVELIARLNDLYEENQELKLALELMNEGY